MQKSDTSYQEIAKCFHLPINEAGRVLKICPTVLKKICRQHNIMRWPYRKVGSSALLAFRKNGRRQVMVSICCTKVGSLSVWSMWQLQSLDRMLAKLELALKDAEQDPHQVIVADSVAAKIRSLRKERDAMFGSSS